MSTDFLDFDIDNMYFDSPLPETAEKLIDDAAEHYGEETAELLLLRAYLLAPEHLSTMVALYRYYYYQHRLGDALTVVENAIRTSARELHLVDDWRIVTPIEVAAGAYKSVGLVRFYESVFSTCTDPCPKLDFALPLKSHRAKGFHAPDNPDQPYAVWMRASISLLNPDQGAVLGCELSLIPLKGKIVEELTLPEQSAVCLAQVRLIANTCPVFLNHGNLPPDNFLCLFWREQEIMRRSKAGAKLAHPVIT